MPPPPAVALIITGYLMSFANIIPCSTFSNKPSDPGTQGTPAAIMVDLALLLSPILFIISGEAPINFILFWRQISEKRAFSLKKPYPG